jgi:2-polyprenyl-6-methoxyphenol hydroxylase-like FAD-dependent oxidoreductase
MSSHLNCDFDIVIVGAGAIGSAMASLLSQINHQGQSPLKIALIESQPAPMFTVEKVDPRVAALTEKTRSIFQQMGMWDAVKSKRAAAYQGDECLGCRGHRKNYL